MQKHRQTMAKCLNEWLAASGDFPFCFLEPSLVVTSYIYRHRLDSTNAK